MRRSNQLVLAGIAFFVVGVVIVLLLARNDGSNKSSASATGIDTVPVLVAKEDIEANKNGEDVVDKVAVRQVRAADRLPDALSTPSQLSGQRLTVKFTAGEQIRTGGLQSRLASVDPPAGKQAVAVRFDNVAGGAEYVQAGDVVNVYQVVTSGLPEQTVKLLLTNVPVLAVSAQSTPLNSQTQTAATQVTTPTQARAATGQSLTLVLSLDSIDSEKVIFGTTFGNLYVTKVAAKQPPTDQTPGRTFGSLFQETPGEANQREGSGQ